MLKALIEKIATNLEVSDPTLDSNEAVTSFQKKLVSASHLQIRTICERNDRVKFEKQLLNLEGAAFFMNWLLQVKWIGGICHFRFIGTTNPPAGQQRPPRHDSGVA